MTAPRIEAPPSARLDEVIPIVIHAAPGAEVTLHARVDDARKRRWESQATFRAGAAGRVELGTDGPTGGDYLSGRPMAFLESMKLASGPRSPFATSVGEPQRVELKATVGGEEGTASVNRFVRDERVRSEDVAIEGGVARWYLPEGTAQGGVLVVSGSGGGRPDDIPALLAAQGFAALSLAYFGMPGLPPDLVEIDVSLMSRALAVMRARPELQNKKLALHGRSRGSELAFLTALREEVQAVIGLAPSGLPWGGITPRGMSEKSAWVVDANPVAYPGQGKPLPRPPPPSSGQPLAMTPLFEQLLEDRAAVDRCAFPLDEFRGAVLLISGGDDALWPSRRLSELVVEKRARRKLPTEHATYDRAGHLINPPYQPTTVNSAVHPITKTEIAFGGDPAADAIASEDAWRRTIAFLRATIAG
jgi:dienelactone hydrolase